MKLPNRSKAAGVAVVTAALALSFAPAAQAAQAAPAGGGSWDDLGSRSVYYQSHYRTKPVKSAGGDFRACITTSSTTKEFYHLYEEDGEVYNPKLVTSVEGAGCWVFRDIGDYVDGDNDRAEFYIAADNDSEMLRVHYYD